MQRKMLRLRDGKMLYNKRQVCHTNQSRFAVCRLCTTLDIYGKISGMFSNCPVSRDRMESGGQCGSVRGVVVISSSVCDGERSRNIYIHLKLVFDFLIMKFEALTVDAAALCGVPTDSSGNISSRQ